MKRAVIIHCWEGNPDYCWYPSVKKELALQGFRVDVPSMPDTNHPKLAEWLPHLTQVIGEPDEELWLIGHSLGCPTIFRYLESLPEGKKIAGVVLVAGYTDDLGYKELSNFFETPIDLKKVKSRAGKFVLIHSDDDPYVDLKYGLALQEELDGQLIVKHHAGHFSGETETQPACLVLPEVVYAVVPEFQKAAAEQP